MELWHGAVIGVQVVAAVLSLAIFAGATYAWASYRQLQEGITTVALPAPVPGRKDVDGVDQNILLVGNDDRTGATAAELAQMHTALDGGGVNTDTMLVLHIPADGSKATGISIPRDSWVDIPGYGFMKLNAVYELGTENGGGTKGGVALLTKEIDSITGLTIDHYVAVSMLGFLRIATVLGPINVCLNQAAQDPYSGTDLPKGVSTLDASQALSFVRQRHSLPRGDLDREVRQQYFLSTEFRKLTQAKTLLNLGTLTSLINAVKTSIVTDNGLNLLSFANQVRNLSSGNVRFATIPTTGTPTIYPNGIETSIVALDWSAIPGFINGIVGQPVSYTAATAARPASVRVLVRNGADVAHLATTTAATLVADGFLASVDPVSFTTQNPDPSEITSHTSIAYPVGMEAQAKALAATIPGVLIAESNSVTAVTLTMGTDDLRVTPKTAAPTAPTTSSTGSTASVTPAPTASASATATASTSAEAHAYSASDCIN